VADSFAPPASPSAGAQDPRVGQDPLTLGNVVFYSGETPSTLTLELEQRLAIHDYPGGARIVQAMGSFAKDFTWESRLRGTAAYCDERSRTLAGYMRTGTPVAMTWRTWSYLVVVRSWSMGWKNAYRNDYKVTVVVLRDLSGATGGASKGGVDGQTVALYSGAVTSVGSVQNYPGVVLPAAQQTLLDQIQTNVAALGQSLSSAGRIATMIATGEADQVLSVLGTVIPQTQSLLDYLETADAVGGLVFQVQSLLASLVLIQKNVQAGQPTDTLFVSGGTDLYDLAARLFGDPSKAADIMRAQNPPLLTYRIPPGQGVTLILPPLGMQ